MRKRITALLMSLLLVLQLVQIVSAEAVSAEDSSDKLAVKVLNGLGIMGVDEFTGDFWDNTFVARREMAQIICNLFRLEPITDNVPKFTDVAEKDRPYIETVVRSGYMSGYGEDRFGPKDYITVAQLVKTIVSALGADKIAENEGGFPNGYITVANRLKLLKNVNVPVDSEAKRIDVANLIYNALTADMVQPSSVKADEIIYSKVEGQTMLTERLNIYRYDGVVEKNDVTSLDSRSGAGEGMASVNGEAYKDPNGLLRDFLGSKVTVFVEKQKNQESGTVIFAYEYQNNRTQTIEKDDLIDVNGFVVNYKKGEKKAALKMSSLVYVIYNGKYIEYNRDKFDIEDGYIKFVDNDANGVYDVALINEYKSVVANSVSQDGNTIQLKYGEEPINLENAIYDISIDGQAAKATDIGSGDVLLVAMSEDTGDSRFIRIEVVTERAIGNIERIFKEGNRDYIVVGDSEYRISDYCKSLISKSYINEIKAGYSGQFFTNGKGSIVYFKIGNSSVKAGYIIKSAFVSNPFETTLKLEMYTEEGKIEAYSSDSTIKINDVKTELSELSETSSVYKQLTTPQLVEYTITDGVIKSIDIACDGYNSEKFSLDYAGTILCRSKSILGDKYLASATTKVFYIPTPAKTHYEYNNIIEDISYYDIKTGSYFNGDSNYTVTLYDISPELEIKYAVVKKNPVDADMWSWNQLLAVTGVSETVDGDGNSTKILTGYNEAGNEISLTAANKSFMFDSLYNREPQAGDVVQYRTDSRGLIAEIQIQHRVDTPDYYTPEYIERVLVNRNAFKCYGEVAANSSTGLKICCKSVSGEVLPEEVDMLVTGGGTAVYSYDSARDRMFKIDFSDITSGDKVFACLSTSNSARMIVVYK